MKTLISINDRLGPAHGLEAVCRLEGRQVFSAITRREGSPLRSFHDGTSANASKDQDITARKRRSFRDRLEFGVVAAVLVFLNLPGLSEGTRGALSFSPFLVAEGQWWRLLTHPLVHVSWYHFLLDGMAFLALYKGLMGLDGWKRTMQVGWSAAGALGLAWWLTPEIDTLGLCGLSGVAHGLMAATGLQMMRDGKNNLAVRWAGGLSLGLVVGKSLVELATGQAFLSFLHFDLMGTPLVSCHFGGVLGGIIACTVNLRSNLKS